MKVPELPLEKPDGGLTEFDSRASWPPAVYRPVKPALGEATAAPGYDSLQDYWHILFRHRKTLLSFALAGLLGAIVISLVQTRIYRVRTSLEFQGTSFLETKGSTESSGSYSTPESYMKTQLEQSEAQLHDYARTSGLTFTSEKDNLAENKLKEIQDELSKAQADRIANQAKFEAAKSKPVDSLPEVLEDPTMREYRQRLTDLQRQYAELSATLTPEHYKVQRVQAQINELKSQMKTKRPNVLPRIANNYAAAMRRETLLSQAHSQQEKIVADQSEKAIHYDTLKRDVDSDRHLYEPMPPKANNRTS